jgi:uncharacterized protein YegP (UPF0339 family)
VNRGKRPHVLVLYREYEQRRTTRDGVSTFELVPIAAFRWRRKAGNGHVIAASTESYTTKAAADRNCRRINADHEACRVIDETDTWRKGGTYLSRDPLEQTTADRPLRITDARGRL